MRIAPRLALAVASALCLVTGLTLPRPAHAETSSQPGPVAAVELPPAPQPSGEPAFLDQVDGRGAVADAINRLTTTPGIVYRATTRILTRDPSGKVSVRSGAESLVLDTANRRVALVSEVRDAKGALTTVSRFVSDGNRLLVAHYTAAPHLERSYYQVPIEGEVETLADALTTGHVTDAPLTPLARWALLPQLENGGYGWRGNGLYYRDADGSVVERPPVDMNGRRAIHLIRRYHFEAKSRLPWSIEEWSEQTDFGRSGTTLTYRIDTFAYPPLPPTAERFATEPAAGYVEAPVPNSARLPDLPGPDEADAKSRNLLARWARAWARFISYSGRVAIAAVALPSTPESRPVPPRDAEQLETMTVYLQRPTRLYIASEPIPPPANPDDIGNNRRQRVPVLTPQTAVSDGSMLAIYNGPVREPRQGQAEFNSDATQLRFWLLRSGFRDNENALTWLLDGPRPLLANAEKAEYRGVLSLPGGGSAEAVTLTQTNTQTGALRRQRGGRNNTATVQSTIRTTIYFDAATGLPARIERYTSAEVATALPRDQPPHRFVSADYTGVRLNEEASAGIFKLP